MKIKFEVNEDIRTDAAQFKYYTQHCGRCPACGFFNPPSVPGYCSRCYEIFRKDGENAKRVRHTLENMITKSDYSSFDKWLTDKIGYDSYKLNDVLKATCLKKREITEVYDSFYAQFLEESELNDEKLENPF